MTSGKTKTVIILLTNLLFLINHSFANKDINNILANDLNTIATKLDDIPETNLNLKLVLLAYECNDIKLNWKIQKNTKKPNKIDLVKQQDMTNKILGYQVVVREYLETGNTNTNTQSSEEKPEKLKDKTQRVYSSKFIETHQNKFKLVNLLRREHASYFICLIIYMDVTETVAFEKQCLTFSLPTLNENGDPACKKNKKTSKITSSTTSENYNLMVTPSNSIQNNTYFNFNDTRISEIFNQSVLKSAYLRRNMSFKTNQGLYTNCEHVTQCKHYANLIIAFVICGVLLATNIFMFTIIIIQNTIKLGLLKHKLNILKDQKIYGSGSGSNYIDTKDNADKTCLNSNGKKKKGCLYNFKALLSEFLGLVCCGFFNPKISDKDLSKKKIENIKNFENYGITNEQIYDSDLTQSCTTITRPGYILQVPNTTISSESTITPSEKDLNISNKTRNLNVIFEKSEQKSHKRPSRKELNYKPNIQSQQQIDQTFNNTSNTDFKHMEPFDNEIFYHVQQAKPFGHQLSSAF